MNSHGDSWVRRIPYLGSRLHVHSGQVRRMSSFVISVLKTRDIENGGQHDGSPRLRNTPIFARSLNLEPHEVTCRDEGVGGGGGERCSCDELLVQASLFHWLLSVRTNKQKASRNLKHPQVSGSSNLPRCSRPKYVSTNTSFGGLRC